MASTEERHVDVPWLAKSAFLDSNDLDKELTLGNRPSGDCCLKGHIHVGNPRGKFETIAGVDTYIVSPNPGQSNVGT